MDAVHPIPDADEAQSLDDAIMALCDDLGLDPDLGADWRNLPDPHDDDAGDEAEADAAPERQSSA